MKKRMLFVDDEPLVLQGLQRMLRPLRDEWEMEFVESGAEALDRMAQAPFDVVVSDMRMPGMNGAELLAEVMSRHPKTVRIILSGHADKELILKCVGSTHQYLSKPCEADALKATVLRATALETTLESERVKELVSQMGQLPSIPSLYSEIVEALGDPETGVDDVGRLVARDIGMTAKVLKLVNSAFFGLRRQVSDPGEAISYLGLDTLKSLVLSIHAFSQFDSVRCEGFSLEALWSHSLDTATCAKQIAAIESAERKVIDEAFVAGMLHDVGKLLLAANFPAQYREALHLAQGNGVPLREAERGVFGASHTEVGGYLLGLWGLPVPVVEAIAAHHNPAQSVNQTFSSLTAVHVANAVVHERSGPGHGARGAEVDPDYLTTLGLQDRLPFWREALQNAQRPAAA